MQSFSLKKRLLSSVAAALLMVSYAHADEPKTAKKPAEVPSSGEVLAAPKVKTGLAGSFLSSRFARKHQDIGEASKYIMEALQHDPKNQDLIHEGIRLHVLAGNIQDAIVLSHELDALYEKDPLIVIVRMLEQVDRKNYKAAKLTISKAPDGGLFGIIKPVMDAWLYIAQGQVKGEVNLKGAIEKSGFFAPFLTYHVALMNDVLGKEEAAIKSYKKASADIAVTPYRVVEAVSNFYQRRGDFSKAQNVFDMYAKANPDSNLIPEPIDKSKNVAPLVGDVRQGMAEMFFTTASILFGEEASQDTFVYLRAALFLRPNLPPAQLMLASLYEQSGDYQRAIEVYDGIERGNVFFRRGQIRKALNLEAMGKPKAALALLSSIAEDYPQDESALITKGDILREQEKFEEAASAYSAAIERIGTLKNTDWPLLYARGICYERAGEWEQAEIDLLHALKLEPNQPDVLNYLAYSWLTLNKNVNKAREYLETAVEMRPDDAHIIDSMGWAYYLSGDFNKAVEYLEKSAEIIPDDATINDHLGDAYWRVGRQTEAKFQWKRALNFKPENEAAELIKKKLKDGLSPFLKQQQSSNGVKDKHFAAE
ncbi:MAG: tetratricopeptide repeat protein [Alphaproteobacteria bacterium]|nr:tetratricopeptide repeat protein [Alphaproteobacteria bacterium]